MMKNEIDSALIYLKELGRDVGQVHMPPPQVGNSLRVWVDGQSLTFREVKELATAMGISKVRS